MPNLRIIYDNTASTATLSTSSTAGSLVASNMQTNRKNQVWRSTSTTASITVIWPTAKQISGVVLPFTNFTSMATMRVRGYASSGDTTPVFDSGTILACPAVPLGLWDWGATQLGANSFNYGGGAYGRCWFNTVATVAKLVIDIVDTTNTSGYLEVGCLVAGNHWSPEVNSEISATTLSSEDTTSSYRTDSGDLLSDNGFKYRTQTLNFPWMGAEDKRLFWNIVRSNGLGKPLLISVFPNDSDAIKEQMHMMYCKLSKSPTMNIPAYGKYSSTAEFEEV